MEISKVDRGELEFPELLAQIAPLAYSFKTQEKILHLEPVSVDLAENLLKKTAEFLSSFQSSNFIPFQEFEDIEEELKRMEIENFRLEPLSFLKIKSISEQIIQLQRFFKTYWEIFPTLNTEIQNITYKKEITEKIDKILNKFGEIKNDASKNLKEIRLEIQTYKQEIDKHFSRALTFCSQNDFLDDIKESVIDDQRVLAVKSGFKKRISGRVLGISKTGSITYIQPEWVVKNYFKLREKQEEEKKEMDKILRNLTQEIALFSEDLKIYQDYIFDLDLHRAKAIFAQKINGVLPKINRYPTLRLLNAFHPLLWLQNHAENKAIFPQSFTLTEHKRIICISGPNAGGKSITLKTLGLLQLMLQSGILVPVHHKSEMFFFDKIMTDIGDNQSIENHLSTYSSRLKKMAEIIKKSDEKTLLLIDEFGTGSDPELGGALAESFLEYFYEKKCFGIITTHYTNIKLKIEKLPAAQNAAMLFNENTLEPLYKLEVGQAGSSFTFEVAEKNQIPKKIIQIAQEKIQKNVMDLDKTIVKLQQEKFDIEKLKTDLNQKKESISDKKNHLEKLNEQVEQKLFNFQKLYEQEYRKLQFGSKIETFIQNYISGKSRKEIVKEFIKILEQEKFKKIESNPDENQRLKIVKRKINQQLRRKDVQEKINQTQEKIEKKQMEERKLWLKIGQRVRISGGNSVGVIEKIEKNKAIINYGQFKLTINTDELERI